MITSEHLYYTDGWHPTVSPSARMACHHYRYAELIGQREGILNEFPRRFGGSTIRTMKFGQTGVSVEDLCEATEWMPWWISAGNRECMAFLLAIYRTAIGEARRQSICARPYERVLGELIDWASAFGSSSPKAPTVGEVLFQVLDRMHREITPDLPKIDLVSFTRASMRHHFAGVLRHLGEELYLVLQALAKLEEKTHFSLLAVVSKDNAIGRVRYIAAQKRLDIERLPSPVLKGVFRKRTLSYDGLIELMESGYLIPGLRLAAICEVALQKRSLPVLHFGNTYGAFNRIGAILGQPSAISIPLCADDRDSWPFCDLPRADGRGRRYPLHLLDIAGCIPAVWPRVAALIKESLSVGRTINLEARQDLNATLSD